MYDKKVFPAATPIFPQDLDDIRKIIRKYYPERAEFFEHAVIFQEGIAQHKKEYYSSFKGTWDRNFPISYRLLTSLYVNARKALRAKLERDYPALFERVRKLIHRN